MKCDTCPSQAVVFDPGHDAVISEASDLIISRGRKRRQLCVSCARALGLLTSAAEPAP